MYLKNYISRGENRLWELIKEKGIIDSELAAEIFPDMPASNRNRILYSLHRKGYLKRARRGLYYNPLNLRGFHELAIRIRECYIGFASALRHHNLIEYEDFTISAATRNFRKKIPLEGTKYEIRFIPLGEFYTGFEKRDNIYVSTLEKTFFDCFLKPNYAGYSILTKALYNANLDWKKFIDFYRLTDNNSLCQRTGYILEMMVDNTGLNIPEFAFDFLQERVKNPVKLMSYKGKSVFNSRWMIQDNIGKDSILSWWI
jgi:predicted transcriptional regulator of viral defense system